MTLKLIIFFVSLFFIKSTLEFKSENQCPPAYSTCNLGIDGYTNVHIIAHTHDDVGWKSSVDELYYGIHHTGVQYIIGTL
jgi:hypothetical protein